MDIKLILNGVEFPYHVLDVFCDGSSMCYVPDELSILDKSVTMECEGNYEFVIQYVPYEKAGDFVQEDIQGILVNCNSYKWLYTHNTHIITIGEVTSETQEDYSY